MKFACETKIYGREDGRKFIRIAREMKNEGKWRALFVDVRGDDIPTGECKILGNMTIITNREGNVIPVIYADKVIPIERVDSDIG